jgi:hypothetical protein
MKEPVSEVWSMENMSWSKRTSMENKSWRLCAALQLQEDASIACGSWLLELDS